MRLGTCLPHEESVVRNGRVDLDAAVAALAGVGIRGCLTNFPAEEERWSAHAQTLSQALEREGVALLEYNTPFLLDTAEGSDWRATGARIVTLLALAEQIGCLNVVTCVCGGNGILAHPDNRSPERLLELRRLCDAVAEGCASQGIRARLLLELVYTTPVWSPAVLARFVDQVGSPNVQGHMDLANILTFDTLYDHAGLARDAFAVCGHCLRSSHVKGVLPLETYFPGLRECLVADGVLDLPVYLECLADMPADFPVLIEHMSRMADIDASHRYVKGVAQSLGVATWGEAQ